MLKSERHKNMVFIWLKSCGQENEEHFGLGKTFSGVLLMHGATRSIQEAAQNETRHLI